MAVTQKVVGNSQVVEFERWTAKRKAEVVLEIIKGKVTLVDFCRANDLKQSEVERWMEEFIRSGTRGLTQGSKDKQDQKEQEIDQLKKIVGEQTLQILALKKSIEIAERDESES